MYLGMIHPSRRLVQFLRSIPGLELDLVYMKEMLEALRDRRTLLVMILLPALVMPLAMLGIPYLEQRQQRQLKTTIPRVAPSITLSVLARRSS